MKHRTVGEGYTLYQYGVPSSEVSWFSLSFYVYPMGSAWLISSYIIQIKTLKAGNIEDEWRQRQRLLRLFGVQNLFNSLPR